MNKILTYFIVDNQEQVFPAYWMRGDGMMKQSERTWYVFRNYVKVKI